MKKTAVFIIFVSAILLFVSQIWAIHTTSRYVRNVSAVLDDEWGGGHDVGSGQVVWYEYSKTTTEFYDWVIVNGVSVPKYKTTVTCHGYGDLHCTGYYYYHD